MEFDLIALWDRLDPLMMIIIAVIILSFLFALYSIALINKRMRLVHEELKQISEDNKLLNESLQFLQSQLSMGGKIPQQGGGVARGM